MPPTKKSAAQDDSSSSSKQQAAITHKGKKAAPTSNPTGSNLKDTTTTADVNTQAQSSNTGVSEQGTRSRETEHQLTDTLLAVMEHGGNEAPRQLSSCA